MKTGWWCLLGHPDCKDYHGSADVAAHSRLAAYTDHAAKVGREYGIRLAVKRRLAR